jgi:ABC-type bacteriocin/lantibiotic exporter with double-glycine peptidase domain
MDESTSALDEDTELALSHVIRSLSSDTTFVIIAHKAISVNNADKVMDFNIMTA